MGFFCTEMISVLFIRQLVNGFPFLNFVEHSFFSLCDHLLFSTLPAPPSAPTNVNVIVATESVVVVTWSRPSYDGGRTDLSYDLQCSACSNIGFCSSNCSGVQFWPSAENLGTTQVTISNLNPAALYNITVISKNGVSEQAGASSVGYSHKTFSLKTPTTRIPESSTTLVAVTEPTATGEIPSHENITTVGGM